MALCCSSRRLLLTWRFSIVLISSLDLSLEKTALINIWKFGTKMYMYLYMTYNKFVSSRFPTNAKILSISMQMVTFLNDQHLNTTWLYIPVSVWGDSSKTLHTIRTHIWCTWIYINRERAHVDNPFKSQKYSITSIFQASYHALILG